MTPYRSSEKAADRGRRCVLSEPVPKLPLAIALALFAVAAVLLAGTGAPIACARDASGGACHVGRETISLDRVVGLALESTESRTHPVSVDHRPAEPSEPITLYRLVLETREGSVPLERGYSNVSVEHRAALVARFSEFLHGDARRFPEPWHDLRTFAFSAVTALLAAALVAYAFRARTTVSIEVSAEGREVVVTRRVPREPVSVYRLSRNHGPVSVAFLDTGGWLALRGSGSTVPLVRLPEYAVAQRLLIERVESVIAT